METDQDFSQNKVKQEAEGPPDLILINQTSESNISDRNFRQESYFDSLYNKQLSMQPIFGRHDSIQSNMSYSTLRPLEELHHATSFKITDLEPKNNKLSSGFNYHSELPNDAVFSTNETGFESLIPRASSILESVDYSQNDENLKKRQPKMKEGFKGIKLEDVKKEADEDEDDESSDGEPLDPNNQDLLTILCKLLSQDLIVVEDFANIGKVDLEILKSIIKRKYKLEKKDHLPDSKESLVRKLNEIKVQNKTDKRSEENNKLVFKRTLKKLLNKFKDQTRDEAKKKKKYKVEFETKFCKKYFSNIQIPEQKKPRVENGKKLGKNKNGSEKGKKSTASSFFPDEQAYFRSEEIFDRKKSLVNYDEKLRKFVINPNTINAKYIKFVFSSGEFKKFFDQYINNGFVKDYQKTRDHKIRKIIRTIYSKKPVEAGLESSVLREVQKDIENNSKFKLPWTDFELKECVSSTITFIDRVNKKYMKKSMKIESVAHEDEISVPIVFSRTRSIEENQNVRRTFDTLDMKNKGYLDVNEIKSMIRGMSKMEYPFVLEAVLQSIEPKKKEISSKDFEALVNSHGLTIDKTQSKTLLIQN